MSRDLGATEQSSGIATSKIAGETNAEGLEDGKLPRFNHAKVSKAASRPRLWLYTDSLGVRKNE